MKFVLIATFCGASLMAANVPPPAVDLPAPGAGKVATAVFAGGQFWGTEAVFERLKGVIAVMAGYAGGKAEDAQESKVVTGKTKHVEAVQIAYDPCADLVRQADAGILRGGARPRADRPPGARPRIAISLCDLLQHGCDRSRWRRRTSARSNARMRFTIRLRRRSRCSRASFPAEDHHQHYVQRNPNDPYVVQNDAPRLKALRRAVPRSSEAVTMDPLLERGIALFNHGEYFECHEVLEAAWTPERGPRRFFLQSLIHMAVGFYHSERGNPKGARGNYAKACANSRRTCRPANASIPRG